MLRMFYLLLVLLKDPKTTKTQNVVTCTGCKLVMSTLDGLLTDPENELAIADALDEVCNYTGQLFSENLIDY